MPSPKIIFQAFEEVKPNLIVAVPLIIEKIIKKSVLPKLETPTMKILLKVPIINDKIKATIREEMIKAFGGNFREIIVGGAAFNQEVELIEELEGQSVHMCHRKHGDDLVSGFQFEHFIRELGVRPEATVGEHDSF